ncbi:patatin family protein [Dictyostelium discoideum AX4]|uniref:Patatin family protein n=1 Tax=Dictyostelium discoideum TaxID=44689 RepID=Q54IM6_DICDI|nr:patatin family protein [Dictyostelium discoideum AX4]EAL63129.1 patatin family protein [Dictyostelium discoideum AX4]|eukprot:XP_636632.1 patatin family protein [Dictyostelium discoideum AX4]
MAKKGKGSKNVEKPCYRILSLDGGGVRSVIECVLLKRIIQVYPNFLDNIDLITGASAGGILSLCLATGKSVDEASDFFSNIVPQIFRKSWMHEISSLDSAIAPAYTNLKLKEVMETQFGDLKLKDLPKKVLIPSFQLDNQSGSGPTDPTNTVSPPNGNGSCTPPKTATNNNDEKTDEELFTGDHLVVDVALRTSAAPTYFPIYQGFVDGGVYANNPSLCAVTSAISSGIKLTEICVLSLSTGRDGKYVSPDQYGEGNWGLAQWAPTLIDMLLDSNVEISDFQCAQLLAEKYHRVDPLLTKNIDLDQPKFIPLLEEIANAVDLTDTFNWIQEFWLKPGDKITPIFTPTTTPSYISPTLRAKNKKVIDNDNDDGEDNEKIDELNIDISNVNITSTTLNENTDSNSNNSDDKNNTTNINNNNNNNDDITTTTTTTSTHVSISGKGNYSYCSIQ